MVHASHLKDGNPLQKAEIVAHRFQQAADERAPHIFAFAGQRVGQPQVLARIHRGLRRIECFDGLLAGERIGDHFIQAAADERIANQIFAFQDEVAPLWGKLVRHQRERNTVVAVHAGDLLHQISRNLDVQPMLRHRRLDHVALLRADEIEGCQHPCDLTGREIHAQETAHLTRRNVDHARRLRNRVQVRNPLCDLTTSVAPHHLARTRRRRNGHLSRHTSAETQRRLAR